MLPTQDLISQYCLQHSPGNNLGILMKALATTNILFNRWLITGMEKAGIDTNKYKAHSTRSASSTAMKRAGMTIQAILAKANWSKKSNTFRRFYDRT